MGVLFVIEVKFQGMLLDWYWLNLKGRLLHCCGRLVVGGVAKFGQWAKCLYSYLPISRSQMHFYLGYSVLTEPRGLSNHSPAILVADHCLSSCWVG